MKITKEMFGKTLGNVGDLFNQLIEEEDFKQFYLLFWELVEDKINDELSIGLGDNRKIGMVYERTKSNLTYLVDTAEDMRKDYAKKIWWFLFI